MTDWTNVPVDVAREIARHGEVRTAALMAVAAAADQRAMTFSGVLATAATASLGAAIAAMSGPQQFGWLVLPSFVAAAFFWASCVLSVLQARPNRFIPPGNHPKNLYGDADYLTGPISQSLGWDAENYQDVIDYNESCLEKNGRLMKAAIWCAALAPIAAAVTWAVLAAWEAWVA